MVSLWPLVALFPLAFGTETCDASARPFKMRVKDDFFSPEEVAQLIAAFGTLELLPRWRLGKSICTSESCWLGNMD